jgi:murein DD-endopeptidase MepM/ murein hydrolase activator NlpD
MIGVVALMGSGLGTFASAGATTVDGSLARLGYEPAGSSAMTEAEEQAIVIDGVDVSRDFDRPELEEQTEQQATEREEALEKVERDINATAEVRERERKELEAREKKAREEREEKARAQAEKRRKEWVLPVKGYRLTARFGQQSSLWSSGAHTGLDFAGASGSKIVSVASGTVVSAGYEGSYGNRTVVKLSDGTEISYSHQSRFVAKAGDKVQSGELIGYTGSTGNVTGPHLHLEVKPPGSGLVDPARVLRDHGVNP